MTGETIRQPNVLKDRSMRLDNVEAGSAAYKSHPLSIMRAAIGEGGPIEYDWFYSFCDYELVHKDEAYHCVYCGCHLISEEWWHCGNCQKCHRGFGRPCRGCGGPSEATSLSTAPVVKESTSERAISDWVLSQAVVRTTE